MGVDLCVFGNHSVALDRGNIIDKEKILKKLNSLKLEDSEFLMEKRCIWINTPSENENEERKKQIRSWEIRREDEQYNECSLVGPFGLKIDVAKHYVEIWHFVWRYHHWFEIDSKERNWWQLYFCKIVRAFGGDYVLYLPDNAVKLSGYQPHCVDMPLDEQANIILKEYKPCFHSLEEATKWYSYIQTKYYNKHGQYTRLYPFVIDKFEDIEPQV